MIIFVINLLNSSLFTSFWQDVEVEEEQEIY